LHATQPIDLHRLDEQHGKGNSVLPIALELATDRDDPCRRPLLATFVANLDFGAPRRGRHGRRLIPGERALWHGKGRRPQLVLVDLGALALSRRRMCWRRRHIAGMLVDDEHRRAHGPVGAGAGGAPPRPPPPRGAGGGGGGGPAPGGAGEKRGGEGRGRGWEGGGGGARGSAPA